MQQGNLSEVTVTDLIEYARREKRPTRLALQNKDQRAFLFLHGGNVTHAVMGDLKGQEVIKIVLGWTEGQFVLQVGIEPPANLADQSLSSLDKSDSTQTKAVTRSAKNGDHMQQDANKVVQTLQNTLAELENEVPGLIAAVIVGMDGLSIAQYAPSPDLNVKNISAQMALLIKLVDTSVTKLNAGVIEDNLLTTANAYVLIWFIQDTSYFLGLVVERDQILLGHLRLVGHIYVERLAEQIPAPNSHYRGETHERTGDNLTTSSDRVGR